MSLWGASPVPNHDDWGQDLVTRLALLEYVFEDQKDVVREALLRQKGTRTNPEGVTLQEIGVRHKISRERVRQLEKKGRRRLVAGLDQFFPGWADRFGSAMATDAAIRIDALADELSPTPSGDAFAHVILQDLGWVPFPENPMWWVQRQADVPKRLKALNPNGPITPDEWAAMVQASQLPREFVDAVSIPGVGRMVPEGDFLVRERYARRDRVIVFLSGLGEASTDEIAEFLGETYIHGVAEFLRRDASFIRLTVKRVWALASATETPRYVSTLPAILEILQNEGPLGKSELTRHVTAVHPVSEWRIQQCLDDYRIGRMPDGRIWLTEHGAERPYESEPSRPDSMTSVNDTIGVRLHVTHDMCRGSWFVVHRWLAWRLGLRASPQSVEFQPDSPVDGALTVSRSGAGTTLSSIRIELLRRGMAEECQCLILLNCAQSTWKLEHVCQRAACPATAKGLSPT